MVSRLAVSALSAHGQLTVNSQSSHDHGNAHVHSDGHPHVAGRSSEGGVLAREYSSEE
jgi:hypothetical protein